MLAKMIRVNKLINIKCGVSTIITDGKKMKTKLLITLFVLCGTVNAFADTSYYWVGGSGNWSAYATHWATASGGSTFHTQVPSSLDDVIFDANSFSAPGQTVTADQTIVYCKNMNWTGVTNTPTFTCINNTTIIKIYGSLTLSTNMNIPFDGHISFEAMSLGNVINTCHKFLQCPIDFNGFGGEWILQDSLATTQTINLNFGTLRTNNNNINCAYFYALTNAPAGLSLGTSTVTLTESDVMIETWKIMDTLLVLDADSAIIKLTDDNVPMAQHAGSLTTQKYNIIEFTNSITADAQYINMPNTTINKVFFNSIGALGACCYYDLHVDSVFGASDLYIGTQDFIKVNYAQVLGDFYIDNVCTRDTINNLIVSGNAYFGGNSTVKNLSWVGKGMFLGNLTIADNGLNHHKFRNCTIIGDGNILSDTNYFDTLKVTIGRTYTFGSNKTQQITQWFDCFGDPGFPIQLVSNNIGQQATLNLGQNIFCSDYLYMRDMNGTGSPNLYVGANSNNVYDNSGWFFIACPVGINEVADNSLINIYPNPISSEATIQSNENLKDATLIVYNSLGQEMKCIKNISGKEIILHRDNLPNGLYIIRLTQESKIIATDKLIIAD